LVCHAELKGWILDWIGKVNDDQMAWAFNLIYNLWLARNDAREVQRIQDLGQIVQKVVAAVEEWRNLKAVAPRPTTRVVERWRAPEASWVKVNTDGAYRQSEGNGGGGVVIRDHHGSFIAGACHFFTHVADAERAELLACRRGMMLAKEIQASKVILETDSTGVMAKLRNEEKDRSFHGPLVEEIKELLLGFRNSSVVAVRRTANGTAHDLAKVGCENKTCRVWLGDPPANIVNSLDLDVSLMQ
jgi:ribonuclease HI